MRNNRVGIVVFVFVIFFVGCKTTRKVGDLLPVLPLREGELVKKVENAQPDGEEFFFRRTLVKLDSKRENYRFKANIWLKKDSFLRMSVLGPMGIEAVRIHFEPGEVVIINRMNRAVIYTGFRDIKKRLGLDVDFRILESLILNKGFSYFEGNDLTDYHSGIENRQYKLASVKDKKFKKNVKNRGANFPVFHRLWFDPDHFYLTRTAFTSVDRDLNVDVNYKNFKSIENRFYFPEVLSIGGHHKGSDFSIKFVFGNISLDGENSISFRIPDQYEKIYR